MSSSVARVGLKRKRLGILWSSKNRKRRKPLSLKRRLIFYQKHGLNAQSVGTRRLFGFCGRLGQVTNLKPEFLPVRNASIVGVSISECIF